MEMHSEGAHFGATDDPYILLHPAEPAPGILAVLARQSRMDEIKQLEQSRGLRVWKMRGIVSDAVPLAGSPDEALNRGPHTLFYVNPQENPLSIYLHSGGRHAVYYDLVGDTGHKLSYIEVRVESRLPSNAIMLARRPLNAPLDVLTRNHNLPLTLQRLELTSPSDGAVLLYQVLLPHNRGVEFGPLGGIQQAVPFAPYDAIYREALTSSSPFYRLLCAARIFEGTGAIRKWLKQQCLERGLEPKLPGEVEVDQAQLKRFGLDGPGLEDVRTAQDLYHKLKDLRDAIAHFLIERDGADVHVYLAEGAQLYIYSTAGSAMLHYAHLSLEQLRDFYVRNIGMRGGHILPTVQNRDQFIVRASEYGLE
jgi:hypothetical protein